MRHDRFPAGRFAKPIDMPSLTVENYLKAILQIQIAQRVEEPQRVTTGALAEAMDVSPGTVTSMLKTLSESQLVSYQPYEGVSLTDSGRTLAMRMLRRHRLIELFLVRTLNLTWDQVHDEAENMEHAVSDFLIDRMDEFLGRPETDPHGSPIPDAHGEMRGSSEQTQSLAECPVGTRVRFVRVVNQAAEFLRYLSDVGFEIGGEGTVLENNEQAGIVTARIDSEPVSMARDAAATIRVVTI